MNEVLRQAAQAAVSKQYAWVPDPEKLDYEYVLSRSFEKKLKKRIRKTLKEENPDYIHVGRFRMRRAVAVALIVALIMVMTACAVAVQRIIAYWNETQNEESGTLDVTFDIDDPNGLSKEFQFVRPETPDGYEIMHEETFSNAEYEIEYRDVGKNVIYYSQSDNVDTMSIGIDNEDADFKEEDINGNKGYTYSKKGYNALIWTDGVALYQLSGTCTMDILWNMALSIS